MKHESSVGIKGRASIEKLLADATEMELGPGAPNAAARPLLKSLSPEDFGGHDRECALACLAGLWLLHNFFDESHKISQELETAEGSYWHGILHRREPDYGNAKYWFRRVPRHPIHEALAEEASKLAAKSDTVEAACLTEGREWSATGFVDLCERSAELSAPTHALCRAIQMREWRLLFDYCWAR